MEVEQAILNALSGSMNYNKLYREASKLRKENNETLSRELFDKSLKNLVNDQIVKKIEISPRRSLYFLDIEKRGPIGREWILDPKESIFLDWLEGTTKTIEKAPKTIEQIIKNDPKNAEESIKRYQSIIASLIWASLRFQRGTIFFLASTWGPPSMKNKFETQNKRYMNLIKRLSETTEKLSEYSSDFVLVHLVDKLEKEIQTTFSEIDKTKKLYYG